MSRQRRVVAVTGALTVEDVAAALKLSRSQTYQLIRQGLIRPVYGLRPMRFSTTELARVLNTTQEPAIGPAS